MIKAIFSDFYGTIVREDGPYSKMVVERIAGSTRDAEAADAVVRWNLTFRKRQAAAFADAYRSHYDLAIESFQEVLQEIGSPEDAAALCELMALHWSSAPLFPDGKLFLESLSLPYYFVTNCDTHFVCEAVEKHGLKPAGIITSEVVHAYKPRTEMFLAALDQAGLRADGVIHVGDSLDSDFYSPQSIGISAVWLNRRGKTIPDDVIAAPDLMTAGSIIRRLQRS